VHSSVERKKSRAARKRWTGNMVIAVRMLRQHRIFPDALKKILESRKTDKTPKRAQRGSDSCDRWNRAVQLLKDKTPLAGDFLFKKNSSAEIEAFETAISGFGAQ
jgi:hypothetical protein